MKSGSDFKGNDYGNSYEIPVICQLYQFLQEQFSAKCEENHQPQECRMSLLRGITVLQGDVKMCLGILFF